MVPGEPRNGNFHLNELRAFSGGQPCALTGIVVVYDEGGQSPKVIDGKIDESMGWANYPRSGQTNTAIVTTRLERTADDELKIELYFSRCRSRRSIIWAASAFRSPETRSLSSRNRNASPQ